MEKKKINFKFNKTMLFLTVVFSPLLVMWWVWLFNGTFTWWYPAVGSFVSIYGTFIASILYQYQIKRRIDKINEKEKN